VLSSSVIPKSDRIFVSFPKFGTLKVSCNRNEMRYINLRFTYLYLLTYLFTFVIKQCFVCRVMALVMTRYIET